MFRRLFLKSFQDNQAISQASDSNSSAYPLSSSNNNTADISYQTATSDDYVPPAAIGQVGDIPPTTNEILPPGLSKTSDVTSDVVKESNEKVCNCCLSCW